MVIAYPYLHLSSMVLYYRGVIKSIPKSMQGITNNTQALLLSLDGLIRANLKLSFIYSCCVSV